MALGWIAVEGMKVFTGAWYLPVAITVIAFIMVILMKVDLFTFTPGFFCGAATFFGAGANLVATIIPLIIGVFLGWISVYLANLVPKPTKAE